MIATGVTRDLQDHRKKTIVKHHVKVKLESSIDCRSAIILHNLMVGGCSVHQYSGGSRGSSLGSDEPPPPPPPPPKITPPVCLKSLFVLL